MLPTVNLKKLHQNGVFYVLTKSRVEQLEPLASLGVDRLGFKHFALIARPNFCF